MRRLLVGVVLALTLVAAFGPVAWNLTHDSRPGDSIPAITSRKDHRAERLPGEDLTTYVERVSVLVHRATAHCADDGRRDPQTWEVAVARRLGIAAIAHDELVTAAGFRCGFCSQRALLLSRILRDNGVGSADAYGLNGHVVTQVQINGRRFISDPDLGVPLVDPMDAQAVKAAYAQHPDAAAMVLSHDDDLGVYSRERWDRVAATQRFGLELIDVLRWVLVALGLLVGARLSPGARQAWRRTFETSSGRPTLRQLAFGYTARWSRAETH